MKTAKIIKLFTDGIFTLKPSDNSYVCASDVIASGVTPCILIQVPMGYLTEMSVMIKAPVDCLLVSEV